MTLVDLKKEIVAIQVHLKSPIVWSGAGVQMLPTYNLNENTQKSVCMQRDIETRTLNLNIGMVRTNNFY